MEFSGNILILLVKVLVKLEGLEDLLLAHFLQLEITIMGFFGICI